MNLVFPKECVFLATFIWKWWFCSLKFSKYFRARSHLALMISAPLTLLISQMKLLMYRVAHQVVQPKRNFCYEVNVRFCTTWCVSLYLFCWHQIKKLAKISLNSTKGCTGWPFILFLTSSWHQNKGFVLIQHNSCSCYVNNRLGTTWMVTLYTTMWA